MLKTNQKMRQGFSLVELIVVVLIMGIIAAVALPKMVNSTQTAKDNSAKASLASIRNAVELYYANNSSFPGTDQASFQTALAQYIKGPFPNCPAANNNNNVRVVTGDTLPLSASVGGTQGWAYNNQTGEVIINAAAYVQF